MFSFIFIALFVIWYIKVEYEINLNRKCKLYLITTKANHRFPRWLRGKNSPVNAEDVSLISGSGRSLEGGNGNPFQYSCLENPMDRGAWWATVHGMARVGYDLVSKPPPPVKISRKAALRKLFSKSSSHYKFKISILKITPE